MKKLTALSLGLVAFALTAIPALSAPLASIPTTQSVLVAPVDPDHFTFSVTGDNRSTGHGEPMPPSLDAICREIGLLHPAFTLWTGDCIEGYGDTPKEADAEYDVFLKSASLTGSPVFNAPGNHEYTLDIALLPVYKKRMGGDLYGSFDYGNSHFIQLNSCSIEADGSLHNAELDTAQWAWLEADLKAHVSAKNIFVFLHHYPFGPADDDPKLDSGMADTAVRDRLHALMVKYGVRSVYAGHNHRYYRTVKDGVEYIISGGAGAPLDASPEQGGFLHYLMVHVDGAKISTDILQPWHLLVDYPTPTSAHVANTQPIDVDINSLVFRVAAPPAGKTYSATAGIAYKKKAKVVETKVLSTVAVPNTKLVDVTVSVHAAKARSTQVDLTLVDSPAK
ncbi:MAG TPA: metallophosphoesterase [Capsulimonadaceae bacterium]|jgi:hypothetical protein